MMALSSPNIVAAQGAFLLSALCFAALGVLWGISADQYPLSVRVIAAAVTPALAFGSLVYVIAIASPSNIVKQDNPLSVKIFAQCEPVGRPVVPPSGTISILQLNAIPAEQGGGGIGSGGGIAGTSIDFGVQTIYRCQITNYSNDPLFKVSLALHLKFSEAITNEENPKSFRSGKITIDRDWLIEIPKIDAGKDVPFIFYIVNASPQFVAVTLPNKIVLSSGPIDLIQPTNTQMVFPPNPLIGKK